jgi:hypothetical protein
MVRRMPRRLVTSFNTAWSASVIGHVLRAGDLRRAYVTHPGLDRTVTGGFV